MPQIRALFLAIAVLAAPGIRAGIDMAPCLDGEGARCWNSAIAEAKPARNRVWFAGVKAQAGERYIVDNTIVLESTYGGTIDGNGAVLEWRGPPDRPLFLVKNTQQLKFTNFSIFVSSPLEAAFEFTKAPYGRDPERNVAPSLNVIDGVRIEGVKLGNLKYGVRFSKKYGIDEDNDQSTIINTAIYNVTEAAIFIEHSQSQGHHFYAVKASGAPGNKDAAFVRALGGSFSSLGGFHGRFNGAVYDIHAVFGNDLILDENSEASARLLRTPPGMASFPMPVQVIGGRFAVDNLAADGRIVDFQRMGPLSISGLKVTGESLPSGITPRISFRPQPVPAPDARDAYGQLLLSGLTVTVPGSSGWELVEVSPAARVTIEGSSCADAKQRVTACRGLAAG
ncbi:MAG: hypothetical protein J0M16_08445, partial [Gammaproteobacteria bacterium]|nr:hypothetical protein [Gammaproteobacteria bacterium]